MADNILKLRVESSEYDQKLKKAAEGIRHLAEVAHRGGGELTGLEKAELDYVKALGSMETKSRTAAGGVRELESTFKELTVVYNNLNDVEKQDEGGKALRASLDQIKQRAQEARAELEAASKSLQGMEANSNTNIGGGIFSGLGSKMEGALAVFGGNLMTKAAGAVAQLGSEMADMVKQGVEMAKAGEGVRIAFERLGRGDILDGLREATHGTVTDLELMKAAVKFNDFKLPLDELGTMLAFAQQKAKDTGQSVDYMVDSIVTGLGRKSLMILDNLGLSATEIRERMKETGDMTKAVGAIIRDQMKNAGDYVETAADRAQQANVEMQNKMEELGRKFAPLQEASNTFWTSFKISILDIVGGPLADFLNGLTEAGRRMKSLQQLQGGGNGQPTKVDRQLSALRGSNFKNEKYRSQMSQYDQDIRVAEYFKKQYQNAGIAGGAVLSDVSKRFNIKVGSGEDIDNLINNLKLMRSEYQKSAKEIMAPVKADINTTQAEQSVASLKKELKNLEEQRRKAVKAGDQEQVDNITKQISQTKTNLGYLDPNAVKTGKGKPKIQFADDSIMAQEKLVQQLTQDWKTVSAEMKDGYLAQLEAAKEKLKEMTTVKPEAGSLEDYQQQLKDTAENIQTIREELLRMNEAGADPIEMQAKEDSLNSAITKLSDIQNKIDYLNGKDVSLNVIINGQGDTEMGQSLINRFQSSLLEAAQNLDLSAFTQKWQEALANGASDIDLSGYLDYMRDALGEAIDEKDWPTIKLAIETGDMKVIKQIENDAKNMGKEWQAAGSAIQSVGNAMNAIEDPAAKVLGTIAQAVATMALSYSQAALATAPSGWGWIAFAATGLSTMMTSIAAIKSATSGFANGGIVPGNSMSGDQLHTADYGINSGELILNRAQQGNLASQLEGGAGLGNLQLETFIEAEGIRVVLNNNGRRTGRGEYVQSRNRRG